MLASLLLQLAATLFYFQAEGPACHWTMRTFGHGAGESVRVHSTAICPAHLVWEPGARRAFYTLEHDLYEYSWQAGGKPVLRAGLPFRERLDMLSWGSMLRVSAASGKVRVAFLEPVADADIVKRGAATFLRRKGTLHENTLSVGMPYFAVAWDLSADGRWTEVAAVPTNWEAGDTLGLAVLSSAMKSKPGTYPVDEVSKDALWTQDWDSERLAVPAARKQEISRMLGADGDGFGYLEWTAGTGIVFPLTVGDLPHASSPVYCCRDSCATLEKLRGLPQSANHRETLSLNFSGDLLLVRPDGARGAWVYQGCRPEPVALGDAESAHWLPFEAAWLRPRAR